MFKKVFYIITAMWYLLPANTTFAFTHADTLRGSNGRGRDWWDVTRYDLQVAFDTANKSISGISQIAFTVIAGPHDSLQIDLQEPMVLDSIFLMARAVGESDKMLPVVREAGKLMKAKFWLIYRHTSIANLPNVAAILLKAIASNFSVLPRLICAYTTLWCKVLKCTFCVVRFLSKGKEDP